MKTLRYAALKTTMLRIVRRLICSSFLFERLLGMPFDAWQKKLKQFSGIAEVTLAKDFNSSNEKPVKLADNPFIKSDPPLERKEISQFLHRWGGFGVTLTPLQLHAPTACREQSVAALLQDARMFRCSLHKIYRTSFVRTAIFLEKDFSANQDDRMHPSAQYCIRHNQQIGLGVQATVRPYAFSLVISENSANFQRVAGQSQMHPIHLTCLQLNLFAVNQRSWYIGYRCYRLRLGNYASHTESFRSGHVGWMKKIFIRHLLPFGVLEVGSTLCEPHKRLGGSRACHGYLNLKFLFGQRNNRGKVQVWNRNHLFNQCTGPHVHFNHFSPDGIADCLGLMRVLGNYLNGSGAQFPLSARAQACDGVQQSLDRNGPCEEEQGWDLAVSDDESKYYRRENPEIPEISDQPHFSADYQTAHERHLGLIEPGTNGLQSQLASNTDRLVLSNDFHLDNFSDLTRISAEVNKITSGFDKVAWASNRAIAEQCHPLGPQPELPLAMEECQKNLKLKMTTSSHPKKNLHRLYPEAISNLQTIPGLHFPISFPSYSHCSRHAIDMEKLTENLDTNLACSIRNRRNSPASLTNQYQDLKTVEYREVSAFTPSKWQISVLYSSSGDSFRGIEKISIQTGGKKRLKHFEDDGIPHADRNLALFCFERFEDLTTVPTLQTEAIVYGSGGFSSEDFSNMGSFLQKPGGMIHYHDHATYYRALDNHPILPTRGGIEDVDQECQSSLLDAVHPVSAPISVSAIMFFSVASYACKGIWRFSRHFFGL